MPIRSTVLLLPLFCASLVLASGCSETGTQPAGTAAVDTIKSGPYTHKVLSASSLDGLVWVRDTGVRLSHASVPCALSDSALVRLYYVDANRGPGLPESVGSAISGDGLNFTKVSFQIEGLPGRKAVDPSILREPGGRYRLYYFNSNAGGDPAADSLPHEIHLAFSDDGIYFRNAGPVFVYPWLVDPDVFEYKGGWFMYVFSKGATIIATSSDGRQFVYNRQMTPTGWGTVAPLRLPDGRLRLYAFDQRVSSGNTVRSFISTNGFDWNQEAGVRLTAGPQEQITDPYVVPWKGGYKMYFKSEVRK